MGWKAMLSRISALTLLAATVLFAMAGQTGLHADSTQHAAAGAHPDQDPYTGTQYTAQEIVDAGHDFFGKTTAGLAEAVEYVFGHYGQPNAYIVGEEGAGAFIGGLRYGEGILYPKAGGQYRVFWQGPSVGFDFGGNGSRTLTLIYNMSSPDQIYSRFVGIEGSAYMVGGLGVNFQSDDELRLAPIRTGVGARLGANFGYLKYTREPTWNPF
jgi:hypothetical protein